MLYGPCYNGTGLFLSLPTEHIEDWWPSAREPVVTQQTGDGESQHIADLSTYNTENITVTHLPLGKMAAILADDIFKSIF